MTIRAIVVAGGTTDSIDDVRTVSTIEVDGLSGVTDWERLSHYDFSNVSKGAFLYAIARALVAMSTPETPVEITVIGKRELVAEHRKTAPPGISFVPFRSFSDLSQAIEAETARAKVDIFAMGAAVSDYSPVPFSGKLPSDIEEFSIKMKRNPKLLDAVRGKIGTSALLVGFKLLSGVPATQLQDVAKRQCARCDCDLTVANDAERINWETGRHPIALVNAKETLWELDDYRETVAVRVAEALMHAWREKNTPRV